MVIAERIRSRRCALDGDRPALTRELESEGFALVSAERIKFRRGKSGKCVSAKGSGALKGESGV